MFDIDSSALIHFGNISPGPIWEMPSHTHDCWEFIYFLRGTGRIETPEAAIRPQQFHLVVYPPGLAHAEVSDPLDPEETIFLGINVLGDPPQGAHLLISDQKGEIGWLCKHILEEVRTSGITRLSKAYCHAFLCLVENAWKTGVPVRHDAIDIAVQYIHANFDKDITLDELAHAACVSKAHLCHCFNARLKTSPLRYLQQFRLEIAKFLLTTTDMPVNEVARQAGFVDPFYFSRLLKSVIGCSPSIFRKKNKTDIHVHL